MSQAASATPTGMSSETVSSRERSQDTVLDLMVQTRQPLTRATYLTIAYPFGLPDPWTPEHEADLPERFQRT